MALGRSPLEVVRCAWAGADPLMQAYHDLEWGVPVHDDRVLFEFLTLEGAQAGLSWSTILRRREGYRAAFADFDILRIAAYEDSDVARLLADPGIIRNRAKVRATIANARAALEVQRDLGSLDTYFWAAVGGAPRRNRVASPADVPVDTPDSRALSTDLRRRGFSFVGPTIMYAFMQATGLVNDHTLDCFRSPD
ncbi:MAG: DNA-3-methyladenine glycosylase I [Dehalococcoidia bacterium]|nr:DNA-3-methyladenine glycosylase I [Dehalococcoidia bacterium]